MSFEDLYARCVGAPFLVANKRILIDLAPAGALLLDGVAGAVSRDLGDADCTIKIGLADCDAAVARALDMDAAFVAGRIRAHGDLATAMTVLDRFSELAR